MATKGRYAAIKTLKTKADTSTYKQLSRKIRFTKNAGQIIQPSPTLDQWIFIGDWRFGDDGGKFKVDYNDQTIFEV